MRTSCIMLGQRMYVSYQGRHCLLLQLRSLQLIFDVLNAASNGPFGRHETYRILRDMFLFLWDLFTREHCMPNSSNISNSLSWTDSQCFSDGLEVSIIDENYF
ncbi:hypothetical protein ANCCAN_17959 [Ancylostoma caninum]|uniref:Uncharacterized protein n=1 Tax=Ancylostoma caninum TaxID=29170 RepID=A0A368FXF5_ANCCA|nr:hypothetical protein ANCCAN_17959 [Ancylostoma caninum]